MSKFPLAQAAKAADDVVFSKIINICNIFVVILLNFERFYNVASAPPLKTALSPRKRRIFFDFHRKSTTFSIKWNYAGQACCCGRPRPFRGSAGGCLFCSFHDKKPTYYALLAYFLALAGPTLAFCPPNEKTGNVFRENCCLKSHETFKKPTFVPIRA